MNSFPYLGIFLKVKTVILLACFHSNVINAIILIYGETIINYS